MALVDNFDSYTDGDLHGQGTWTGHTDFDVQGTTVQEGAKAVSCSVINKEIVGTFTQDAAGVQTIWGRTSATTDDTWSLRLREGASDRIALKTQSNELKYYNGAAYVAIGTIANDTWFRVDIEWKASDDTARYRLNGGAWTSFASILASITTGIDGVCLQKNGGNGELVYWDTCADGEAASGWTYEQKFNSLATGDLHNKGGWIGGTNYDVSTNQSYEGGQAVEGVGANQNIDRPITEVTLGTMYFAMRHSGTGDASFKLEVSTGTPRILFIFDGTNVTVSNGGADDTLIATYTDNQWYVFEVNFDASNQHTVRYHNGSSWSSLTSTLSARNNGNVGSIRLNMGASGTAYWDTITPTNPVTASASNALFMGANF